MGRPRGGHLGACRKTEGITLFAAGGRHHPQVSDADAHQDADHEQKPAVGVHQAASLSCPRSLLISSEVGVKACRNNESAAVAAAAAGSVLAGLRASALASA